MKKTILIFILIIFFLYITLNILDWDGEYIAEKMIWKANQKFFILAKDPVQIPDKNFAELDHSYQKIINRFPNSPLSKRASLSIARIYLIKKDYPTAREKASITLKQFSADYATAAEALSIIAKSYELNGDWGKAVEIYSQIVLKYPISEIGLNIPIYISIYYQSKNDLVNSKIEYQKAIEYYKKIVKGNPNSQVEFKSLRLLANCYFEEKMWLEGVYTLRDLLIRYATKDYLPPQRINLVLKTINTVSISQLKSYDIPVEIYENFILTHPQHGLNKVLKEMIKALNTLRNKNVEIKNKKK